MIIKYSLPEIEPGKIHEYDTWVPYTIERKLECDEVARVCSDHHWSKHNDVPAIFVIAIHEPDGDELARYKIETEYEPVFYETRLIADA